VHFHTTRDLATLRGICEEFIQEAALLATGLAQQRRYDVQVDWDGLTITPLPDRPEQLVQLNDAGDSLLLTLPLLKGSPALLTAITPWLKAVTRGEEPPQLSLDAGDFGWTTPPP
jgi:hypothetical protein